MHDREIRLTYDRLSELGLRRRADNPKAHDLPAILASVERVGYITPVVVNDGDERLLEGHGRVDGLLALRSRDGQPPPGIHVAEDGEWLVPAIHGVHLGEREAKAFVIAANRTVELGGWDNERLTGILLELAEAGSGLEGVGYDADDLDRLLCELLQSVDRKAPGVDLVPPAPDAGDLYVHEGEVYRLGAHVVACGDARDAALLHRLLKGPRAHCLLTDPPYGVEYQGGTTRRLTIRNDDAEGLDRLLKASFAAVDGVLTPGAAVYLFHPAGPLALSFMQRFVACGWSLRQTLVWLKDSPVLGRSDYHYKHEPILFGYKAGGGRRGRGGAGWHGGNDATSVLEFARPKASREHPTMKPVPLLEVLLRNSTRRGDIVLDPFLGSASTLVAAERLGRRCVGVEIDPRYAQVAIERWQRLTGREAVLEVRA